MSKKDWIGILYVSVSVIIWGTVGSLIDFLLLEQNFYKVGSLGQLITFTMTGLFTTVVSIIFYKRILNKDV